MTFRFAIGVIAAGAALTLAYQAGSWQRRSEGPTPAASAASAPATGHAASAPAEPPANKASPEAEAEWLAARAAFFDQHLRQQPRQASWAEPLEAKVRKAYQGFKGVTVAAVECRSSACRVEFACSDADARQRALEHLPRTVTELSRASYAYPGEPHEHTRAVAYLAMDEQPLPPFEVAQTTETP